MNTIKDRILEYIEKKNLSVRAFEMRSGLSNGYINRLRKEPSPTYIDKILNSHNDINEAWLMRGEGPMLKEDEGDPVDERGRIMGGYIGDEEEYQKAMQKGLKLIPEVADVFKGGNGGSIISYDYVTAYWGFANLEASIVVEVEGDSMTPAYPPGARVALKKINFDPGNPCAGVPFGEVFGIVLQEDYNERLSFLKILRRHPDKERRERYWIAQSINKDRYDDFEIEISKVRCLFVAVACVTLRRI